MKRPIILNLDSIDIGDNGIQHLENVLQNNTVFLFMLFDLCFRHTDTDHIESNLYTNVQCHVRSLSHWSIFSTNQNWAKVFSLILHISNRGASSKIVQLIELYKNLSGTSSLPRTVREGTGLEIWLALTNWPIIGDYS
jgi:hypothetical protein